jgi:hypothetical protein
MRIDQLLDSLSNCLTIDTASGSLYIYGNLQQDAVKSAVLYADNNGKIIAAPAGTLSTGGSGTGLTSVGINNLTATGTPSSTTFLRGDNKWEPIDFSPYLAKTGGTMTGALGGTSASFSSTVSANGMTSTGAFGGTSATFSSSVTVSSSVTATGFFESSSILLKDIIRRDGDVIYFKWKDKKDEQLHIGYVAEEVKVNNPDQVITANGYLAVNYVEVLVEKVRALEKEVKELKIQLARL